MTQSSKIVNRWLQHRTVLQDILAKVPDDQFSLRPWDNGMTLGELAVHMVTSSNWFAKSVTNGKFERPTQKYEAVTASEVRALVDDLTEQTKETLSGLTDNQVEGIVSAKELFGMDAPGKVWLNTMVDHEIHHKGQMFVYARMAGVTEMPFFINRNV